MTLLRYEEGFENTPSPTQTLPPSYSGFQDFYPQNVLISSTTTIFEKLLSNNADFFNVYINQN